MKAPWTWLAQHTDRTQDTRQGVALEPIRSEIFGLTRFEEHGRSLGSSHRAMRARFGLPTFYPRLQSNIRSLRQAYRDIAQETLRGNDISPAAEWLFDNFHLIESQLLEIREGLPASYYRSLPLLQDAPLTGLPRIYGVAWAFVAHTDSAFDETLLVHFLNAYQETRELTQGELWALPTTFRVVLVENLRRLADRVGNHKAARDLASQCASRRDRLSLDMVVSMRAQMDQQGVGDVFLSHLARSLVGHFPAASDSPTAQIRNWMKEVVPDLNAMQIRLHASQAADHLSVGNAVTSLRLIDTTDWPDIVARTSRVIRVMCGSPVFMAEDDATRDTTLHGIERLSSLSGKGEADVASTLLGLMGSASGYSAQAGHWLQGSGRSTLEQALGLQLRATSLWRSAAAFGRLPVYLSIMLAGTLLLVAWLLHQRAWTHLDPFDQLGSLLTGVLMLVPASETVVAIVNRIVGESVKPAHLPRLLLADGIPPNARVMVVIPMLLNHHEGIAQTVHRLHLHHLANPEIHAQFALLSDWSDADSEQQVQDQDLLSCARQLIADLNTRYPSATDNPPKFLLLHRPRSWCATQGQWLGWERKRGKLEQLVAALATSTRGPFFDLGALSQMAPDTRYVLTLDSDTLLPPGRLRTLVGIAEHPGNQPRWDEGSQRVRQGYGILQPRVVTPLAQSSGLSIWQWLFSGHAGVDPYSAMSSDVYQDLFAEGSFTGKGLLHVATVHAVLGQRLPAEQVLSHDLLEGSLVRCAVVTDVTLIEPDPCHSDNAASRLHRWIRGDWQLLPFLLQHQQWPLGAINRWKLFDNLRRSLLAPACLLLIVLAMMGTGLTLSMALALALAAYSAGPLMAAVAGWIPYRWHLLGRRHLISASKDLLRVSGSGLWHLVALPHQALLSMDAVGRTLYRVLRSRRHLLEWTTSEAAQSTTRTDLPGFLWRHRSQWTWTFCLAAGAGWLGSSPDAMTLALLGLWLLAPLLMWCGNTPALGRPRSLMPADRQLLEGLARDTWRLFERTVDADNHHLPPDNLQSWPYEMVAHRTSPTNIGLYLLSTVCARQFGWIGTQDLMTRLEETLATMLTLERHRGHFLNWYDTRTLAPLPPRYVSTVDSGNLSVHLLAVAQACTELADAPSSASISTEALRQTRQRLQSRLALLPKWLHRPLSETALGQLLEITPAASGDKTHGTDLEVLLQQARDELCELDQARHPTIVSQASTPRDELVWLLSDHLATLESAHRDTITMSGDGVGHTSNRLRRLAAAFESLAWAPDFRFLYHPRRHLLHIGYRVDDQRLDTSCYDLLASEARSTSLLAIAKGDVEVRHWAALGRPFFASAGRVGLRSWSGSMFEYLMPSLVVDEPRGSVLREAGRSAVEEQKAFTQGTDMPWGMSECAYAAQDHTLAYQYAPHGVPRLAMRRSPSDERVIAPYATVLATQVGTAQACANLRRLDAMSARGRYGLVEALDFTPARQVHGASPSLVHSFMAHHQGMSLVALANVLHQGVAQRWGMAHPRMQAVLSLLHERAPRDVPSLRAPPELPLQATPHRLPDHIRTIIPGAQALEPTHLLSNGRYSVTLRSNGAGWSQWGRVGINRWRDDALRDACGHFIYLRRKEDASPVSVTSHPAPDPQATYSSRFHADRVCLEAAWPTLRVSTTVWVSPEDDVELRKLVLVHTGDQPVELELISTFDLTLTSHAADEAHPAFSGMFVKTRWLPGHQALHCQRTPRLPTEPAMHAAHFVADTDGQVLGLSCQTDRQRWLGRRHTPGRPLAQMNAVSSEPAELETGLDPVVAIGVRLRIEPGTQVCVIFATAASDDPARLMSMIDKYRQSSYVARSSVMSATLAAIPAVPHRPRIDYLPALQVLTTSLVLTLPKVDQNTPEAASEPPHASDRRFLWTLGISGDRPILLVQAGSPQGLGLLRVVGVLLREWTHGGIPCDLVVLNHESHSHHMPVQQELSLLREQHAADLQARPGTGVTGLHLLRADDLSPRQLGTLQSLARMQLHADGQSLLHQVRAWCDRHETPAAPSWRSAPWQPETVPLCLETQEAIPPCGRFLGERGGFAFEAGTGMTPQRPWCNVLANPDFGALVSDSGGGNTWALNSRLNQLTAWSNDPVGDPSCEFFLLQDRRTREIWSMTPSAWAAQGVSYEVIHGQGTTTMRHQRGDLRVSVTWCVDTELRVKQIRIKLENHGQGKAHLRIIGLVEWMMGERRGDRASLMCIPVFTNAESVALEGLLCTQVEEAGGLGGGTAFFCESFEGVHDPAGMDWTCDRRAFFDRQGQLVIPRNLGQRSGFGLDPCAALARQVTLRAGASVEQVFLLGYALDAAAALSLMRQARPGCTSARELAVLSLWDALLGNTTVSTPDPLFDVLVNRWLLYQSLSSRMWAKAGFYQAGGATGYRDQLQDAMALTGIDSAILRSQIVRCASRQFEAGDVQHWWHEPGGAGVRTHFSDDLLWLPYAISHYLHVTDDTTLLDEPVPFLSAARLPEGVEDRYDTPSVSLEVASIFEHGARAIDRSLAVGAHGLPLMGTGDWNDGMNRVGHEGRGESVWLAWFLCSIVSDWLPLARSRGQWARTRDWEKAIMGWRVALGCHAWDGDWFRRAFFDDGTTLGSAQQTEAQIDLIAQAWSVLSNQTSPERQHQAMQAVHRHLVDPEYGLIRLLNPPLVHASPPAGYIQAYPPGVRENGGQYTHAAVWVLMASAQLAQQETADVTARNTPYRWFTYLSPAHRAQHPRWGPLYGVEPYAVAADVYSQPPYQGRGGWTWYTGAASWLHRAAVESILGLQMSATDLCITPCLPSHWPSATLTLLRGDRRMHFVLVRGDPSAALAALMEPAPRLLRVGEHLKWLDLPSSSHFVVPLPGDH